MSATFQKFKRVLIFGLLGACGAGSALAAGTDPFIDALAEPESAGIGLGSRIERSPYLEEGTRGDLLPIHLYEGRRLYLHAYRLGMKFEPAQNQRIDVFLSHRFEGYTSAALQAALAGMGGREPGLDAGLSYRYKGDLGAVYGEFLQDTLDASHGRELRLGYDADWRSGALRLQPQLMRRHAALRHHAYPCAGTA